MMMTPNSTDLSAFEPLLTKLDDILADEGRFFEFPKESINAHASRILSGSTPISLVGAAKVASRRDSKTRSWLIGTFTDGTTELTLRYKRKMLQSGLDGYSRHMTLMRRVAPSVPALPMAA